MAFKRKLVKGVGLLYFIAFIYLTLQHFNFEEVLIYLFEFLTSPFLLAGTVILYSSSFILRALSWKLYLRDKASLPIYLNGLWYSLFINHILPVKAGDIIRMYYLRTKNPKLGFDKVAHSVIVMRGLDLLALMFFSVVGLLILSKPVVLAVPFYLLGILAIITFIFIFLLLTRKPKFLTKHVRMLTSALSNRYITIILLCITLSWIFEAAVVYFITFVTDSHLALLSAVWVNSMTIGGQVFQFLPGGIATYETTMAFTLSQLNFDWEKAYQIALLSHIFKFIFSYIVGAYVLLTDPVSPAQLRDWLSKKEVKAN